MISRILMGLTREDGHTDVLMLDAIDLKAHRTANRVWLKGGQRPFEPLPDRALRCNVLRGTKLHAVTDAPGRPIGIFLTAESVSDYTGARAMIGSLVKVDWRLGPF